MKPGDKIDDYTLLHECGRGAFGTVFLAMNRNGELVALKAVSLLGNAGDRELQALESYRKCGITGYSFKGSIEETIYSEKLTPKKLCSGETLVQEAEQAAERHKNCYDQIGKPKIQDNQLVVIGTKEIEDHMPGLGGNFSFYELGEPLLIDNKLNENIGVDKIREYIWFTETKTAFFEPVSPDNDAYLGSLAGTSYYFYYERDCVTTLDHEFIGTIKNRSSEYVIYADLCTLADEELKRFGIIFKKIPRDIAKV